MGVTVIPDRTLEQRLEALALGNDIRMRRATLKGDMKAGLCQPLEVWETPPPEALTMQVFDFLLAVPRVGRVKANKWLAICQMSPTKTLGGATERQRRALAVHLRAQATRCGRLDRRLSQN